MDKRIDSPCIMAIFGGTGDLAHRKLIPALYNLYSEGLLPEEFAIVGIGKRTLNHVEYRNQLLTSVEKFSRYKINPKNWDLFVSKVYYYQMDFSDSSAYEGLKVYLENLDDVIDTKGNRLYYLSVAPAFFETITINLQKYNMAENAASWQRLVIEKPFGKNLETAKYLNNVISAIFPPENIFRIDHYLGKEMLQSMLVIRFGNAMFESIWNSRYIDNIQITSSETVGVENRAAYYESSGALRDMVQNHMLQLLALIAMEAPASIDAKSIKDEKVKLLRSLNRMGPRDVHHNIIRGQYGSGMLNNSPIVGYSEENGVSSISNTETYVAMRLFVGNFRWGNMPFYLRTGKRMPEKTTYIVIEFKSLSEILYFKEYQGMQPNLLEIRIQPKEGISFQFNAKKPGTINEITNVKMDFCQNCNFEANSPEAYERLLADVLRNDQTLFTSWDEVEASWSFIDSITEVLQAASPNFPNYAAGSRGPIAADALLAENGYQWWNI